MDALPLASVGRSTGGTQLFRHAGKLHLTCAAKATFKFVPGKAMRQASPEDLFRSEVPREGAFGVRATSDLVPYLPRVDIVLTGHAYAPTGTAVTSQSVRLVVAHTETLLDKTLHIQGEKVGSVIKPFERMPLGAAFGPLSRMIFPRTSLLGSLSLHELDKPIPDLPDDFDWSYLQSVPSDQQIAALAGDEWIMLEGLHPKHASLSSRLPTVRGLAKIFGLVPGHPDEGETISLRPDIVRIDADGLRASVVFRGVMPIDDVRMVESLRVAVGVETEEVSIEQHLVPPEPMPPNETTRTMLLSLPTPARPLPSVSPGAKGPSLPIPGAPWSSIPVEIPPAPQVEVTLQRPLNVLLPVGGIELDEPTLALPVKKTPNAEVLRDEPTPPSVRVEAPPPSARVETPPPSARVETPPPSARVEPKSPDAPAPTSPSPPAMERPAKQTVWAEQPPAPKTEAPRPAPPRIPPRPSVNKSIYGGFGPKKKG